MQPQHLCPRCPSCPETLGRTKKSSATSSFFARGQSEVDAREFSRTFDAGLPPIESGPAGTAALVLHLTEDSRPSSNHKNGGDTALSVQQATENCLTTRVIYIANPKDKLLKHQCLAIVPQGVESYHVHNFMRIVPDAQLFADRLGNGGTKLADVVRKDLPARLVSRTHMPGGGFTAPAPQGIVRHYWDDLVSYHQHLPRHLGRLKPICKAAASIHNSIVVSTVNQGQSELLTNWVCHCRARGLSTNHMVVFATDAATTKLATNLGLHVFDVQDAFGRAMPMGPAKSYGDSTFRALMLAKVYAVHMPMLLGYSVLFQDVDVVWYRDALEFFHATPELDNWDVVFQDDGARARRFAPYAPNSGMYFMRHNTRTLTFMNDMARRGDLILSMQSHQTVVAIALTEHSSAWGLHVKVMGRGTPLGRQFPCGYHYHRDKSLMLEIAKTKTTVPVLFHMSWTNDKRDKRNFMEQMGQWFTQESCIGDEFDPNSASPELCCAAEPLVQCHFSDKASVQPCKSSPALDRGGRSFW